ncbi:MAG TPA: NAD-dependent epimerase/dehydratase family protein [Pirellulales bacterium]|jgi:nucleoside-diphosphate-sugar epimerase|nr:NAD-dependent epimerase/dehydratase family protein [Pirellulales bacterium]
MQDADPAAERNCAVTGATGYLGSRLCESLAARGWNVFRLTRRPAGDDAHQVPFSLNAGAPADFFGRHRIRSLVHCSWDFRFHRWSDIEAQNVQGSIRLLRQAHEQGVSRIVFISTMSAFPGCKSLYGRAKLAVEREAAALGAIVVRPGLIYGERPGGMVGALTKAVRSLPLVPLIGDGRQMLYAIHEDDLATLVERLISGSDLPAGPVIAACERGLTFRQVLETLAARDGRRPKFLPVPWRLIWAPLRLAEAGRLPLKFRSDSVISLVNQDPHPDFAATRALGVVLRDFRAGSNG